MKNDPEGFDMTSSPRTRPIQPRRAVHRAPADRARQHGPRSVRGPIGRQSGTSSSTSAVLVLEAVERLARSGLEPQELFHEISTRVGRVVPHTASAWMTLDPDTLLPSSSVETELPPEVVRALWRNERLGQDLNRCVELARAAVPVATLFQHEEAMLAESERFRRILGPVGLGDELRAILRSNGTTLGVIALYRETGRGAFTREERSFMSDLAQNVAEGLRRSLVRRPSLGSDAGIVLPGVARFTEDGELSAATAEARRIIRLMPGDFASTLYTVAMDAAYNCDGARSRVRLPDGRWILVHGARLHAETGNEADMAVTLMPAPTHEIVPMLLRLHSLTAREREVAELLMSGWKTDAIAARLYMSRHTLRDHTKAIFQKIGTTSRSQLMALANEPLAPARATSEAPSLAMSR